MSFLDRGRGGFLTGSSGGLDLTSGGTINGNLIVTGTLSSGAATLASATVTGAATVGTTLGVTGAGTFSSTLRAKIRATTPVDIGVIVISSQFDPSAGDHQRFNTSGSSFTMNGGPIILAGTIDGQRLLLENTGASGAATITDLATDTDSGVITLSGSVGIGALDIAEFIWDSTRAVWVQCGNENN